MTIMTIEELRRLEAEATEGPWWSEEEYSIEERGLSVIAAREDCGPMPGNPTRGQVAFVTELLPENASRAEANAALIVAMRNALPELLKALEWQPIETAPKDEVWVMLHYRDECVPIISFFSDGAWAHQETMGRDKPTHWMPLPLPPHGGVDVG